MMCRCMKNLNKDDLATDLSLVPWYMLTDLNTVDDELQTFETLLTDVWNNQATLKRPQWRQKSTLWITSHLYLNKLGIATSFIIFIKTHQMGAGLYISNLEIMLHITSRRQSRCSFKQMLQIAAIYGK